MEAIEQAGCLDNDCAEIAPVQLSREIALRHAYGRQVADGISRLPQGGPKSRLIERIAAEEVKIIGLPVAAVQGDSGSA